MAACVTIAHGRESRGGHGRGDPCRSGWDTSSSATDHARPGRERGIAVRKLNDGREYRIVKVFHEPAELARRLAALGLASCVVHTPRNFIHGAVTRLQRESS